MDFLQTTVRFLEEQNRELKERLKRMSDLNQLITQQRETEQRDFLHKFHQEEIAVIREIAHSQQQSLKNQIKQLTQEISQLHSRVEQELDNVVSLRRDINQLQDKNGQLLEEVEELQGELDQARNQMMLAEEQFEQSYKRLQDQYRLREEQVIGKYMGKLEQSNDQHEVDLRKQAKFIDFLHNKLNIAEKEKALLSEEVASMVDTLNLHQHKLVGRTKAAGEEAGQLRRENNNLKVYIKNLQLEIANLQSQKNMEMVKAAKWEKVCAELKARQQELYRSKDKEVEREKSRNKSINKDLSQQKKMFKQQLQKEKRKEMDFNHSKKLLISKIKEIESKYEHGKSHQGQIHSDHNKSMRSIFDKTSTKTVKKSLQTFQSTSLDNSFNREKESPSVSCFLKDDKTDTKPSLKKVLKIDTNSQISLLTLRDLDTPCFEASKAKSIKRTIKIRK